MTMVWSPDYAPVDGDFDSVSLLLKGEGTNGSTTILDSSSNNLSVTAVDNAQIINTVATPFSPTVPSDGVLAFDGTGDYLSTPVTPFQFLHKLTDSWTVEGWIYRLSATQGCLFDTGGASNNTRGTVLLVNANGDVAFIIRQSLSSLNVSLSAPSGTVNTNAWYHLAVCYDQSTVKLFIDGVLLDSVSYNTQTSNNATQSTLKVGVYEYSGTTLGGFLNGYISNLRITKGVARYTENFDVPTAPFPIYSPTTRAQA